jgi:ATP-dependent Zn protease
VGNDNTGNDNIITKRAAYHESGHAVCGPVLNFVCGGAVVRTDGSGSANVASAISLHWDLTRGGDIRASVCDKLTVCWSGPVAETIKFGDAADHGDRAQIKQFADRFFVSDQDIAAARERARELLLLHWGKVEAVAAALLKSRTLSAAALDAIFAAAAVKERRT